MVRPQKHTLGRSILKRRFCDNGTAWARRESGDLSERQIVLEFATPPDQPPAPKCRRSKPCVRNAGAFLMLTQQREAEPDPDTHSALMPSQARKPPGTNTIGADWDGS